MKTRIALMAAAPLLLLTACGDDAATGEGDDREASGEVLEGTISDAMLPLDEVRSQPPLAEPEPGEGGASSSSSSSAAAEATEEVPEEGAPDEAPAEESEPEEAE